MTLTPFRRSPRLVSGLILLAVLAFYVRAFANALIDDTFITLVYVRNLALHGAWGFFPGEPLNTATSPLNVIGLAAITILTRDPVRAVFVFSVAVWFASAVLLGLIGRRLFRQPWFGAASTAALLANPLLISTLGLESYLFILCYLASLWLFIRRRWSMLAVALGALTLARIDGVLAFGVFWLFVPGWRRKAGFTLLYGLVILPWHLFAWIHLGSFFPDTLFIKASQKTFGGYGFATGLWMWFKQYPAATVASLLPTLAAPLALRLRRQRVRRVALAVALYGLAHFAGYAALRVPPYHWYYISTLLSLILLGALGLAEVYRRAWRQRRPHAITLLWCAAALPVLAMAGLFVRAGRYELELMPIQSNWATHAQYQSMASPLSKAVPPRQEVVCDVEIGTLAYYSSLNLRNEFSDRRVLMDLVQRILKPHGLRRFFTQFNFYWRPPVAPPPPRVDALVIFPAAAPPPAGKILLGWPLENIWLGRFVIALAQTPAQPRPSSH